MENLELNEQEKKELEKRGFFVKDIINFMDFTRLYWLYLGGFIGIFPLITVMSIVIFGLTLGSLGLLSETNIFIVSGLFGCLPIFFLLRAIFFYSFIGKFFYINNKVMAFGKKFTQDQPIKYLEWIKWSLQLKKRREMNNTLSLTDLILTIIFNPRKIIALLLMPILVLIFMLTIIIVILTTLYILYIDGVLLSALWYTILSGYIIFFLIPTISYLIRQLVEHFHPLYAFGNIGEKIQKLTPKIEEQSQKIQSEFQSDMNFSVLSNGFDSLSATFSEIVSLVIKLEKVEARANKGNLFDSEKYINSLRSDIITPLTSLKTFLEKQNIELIHSRKELTRVRVGGSESTGNMELQSKRSESLIQELMENIEKLDVMIGKMG